MIKALNFLMLGILLVTFLTPDNAEARKKRRKFKGVIIVNQILRAEGTLTRNGEPAPQFSGIKSGDTLETGENSLAVIKIPGLMVLKLGANTKIKLTQFADRNNSRLELVKGEAIAIYRRLGFHEFKTPHGVIRPFESTFYINTSDSDEDKLCLCNGKINIRTSEQVAAAAEALKLAAKKPAEKAVTDKKSKKSKDEASPSPSPEVSPSATPEVAEEEEEEDSKSEMMLRSEHEHKVVYVTDKELETKRPDDLKSKHTDVEIREMESLYALP